MLATAWRKLSGREILKSLSAEERKPDRATLWRWLNGPASRAWSAPPATATAATPIYWLPGREPLLWPGDSASEEEKEWRQRCKAHERSLRDRAA
jgi:hypothetical protein